MLRAALGSVLYLALIALLSLGIAAAVRDGAAAIGIVLGLLYLFPILGQVVGGGTAHRHLEQLAPMTAGLAIQATTGLRSLPISPWAGLGVLAAWAAGALPRAGNCPIFGLATLEPDPAPLTLPPGSAARPVTARFSD